MQGLNFNQLQNEPSLTQVLNLFEKYLAEKIINCARVGIVQEYDAINRVAKVQIANKLVTSIKTDGSQVMQDYAPIYAKVLFFGYGNVGITSPIQAGTEGLLIFCDREIESWYINGGVNHLAYNRTHDKTDAIFISGLLSLPNMLESLQNCLNIFYGNTNIQLDGATIVFSGDVTFNGNLQVNGSINATGDIVAGGISLINHVHGNGNDGQDTTAPKG